MKRPFYIIGHNPNTIEEACEFLEQGANGLAPDIVHDAGKYYVSHQPETSYEGIPTVQEYLQDLKALLLEHPYNLAMLIWDIKTTDFDPNKLMALIKENFAGASFDGVTMLMTHSDDHDFINRYKGNYANLGVGVDESNVSPLKLQQIFRAEGQKNITYADGITSFLTKPGVFRNITDAQSCRRQYEPASFGFIYTWVLSQEASLRTYLNTYIDGIMVDASAVKKLLELIASAPYDAVYELAQNGYNPFTAAPPPAYLLSVKTADKLLAGTDATIVVTLTGEAGCSLKSLPFDANTPGALERGSITWIHVEGIYLGEIKSITLELITHGPGSGWLPELISVQSKRLKKQVDFYFNTENSGDWITARGGAFTKHVW